MAPEASGYRHGLKYYVGGVQYARMAVALAVANIDSASDSAIADYAKRRRKEEGTQLVSNPADGPDSAVLPWPVTADRPADSPGHGDCDVAS